MIEIIDSKSGNGAFYVAKVDGGFIAGFGDKIDDRQQPKTAEQIYSHYRPIIEMDGETTSHQAFNICYVIQDYLGA